MAVCLPNTTGIPNLARAHGALHWAWWCDTPSEVQ